jgi:hypothetical protein
MDVWRPITQENAFSAFAKVIENRLAKSSSAEMKPIADCLLEALKTANAFLLKYIGTTDKQMQQTVSRHFAFGLSRIYMGSLLFEHAAWSNSAIDVEIARRWSTEKPLIAIPEANSLYRTITAALALDIDPATKRPRHVGDKDVNGQPRAML